MQMYLSQSCAETVTRAACDGQNCCSVLVPQAATPIPAILATAGARLLASRSGLPQLYRLGPAMHLSTSGHQFLTSLLLQEED